MRPWLTIVGIGEDGLDGLSPVARQLVDSAELLIGGARHLAMVPADGRERLAWPSPLGTMVGEIEARRGQRVCVLASGDPLCYGVGAALLRVIPIAEVTVVPAPSAFSLACARLGWSLPDVDTLTLHGRPLAQLQPYIYPGARLLALSNGPETPAAVAELLCRAGYGDSRLVVLEHMGGVAERRLEGQAEGWPHAAVAQLNTLAIDCVAGPRAQHLARLPGLPDAAYRHDGQLTKREVRAASLSALAPLPGELLWDVGAGCGSIAIEWMRSDPRCRAVAVEREPARHALIADNAEALGVPKLEIRQGDAPTALAELPPPDAVYIGGGLDGEGVFEACWAALKPGGRLVANVVTLEGEARLLALYGRHGGDLTRLAVERAEPVGGFTGWKPYRTITQWTVVKPPEAAT
jgi:precorrin-6Y C5,15-methyltransferase (decarboxylating)